MSGGSAERDVEAGAGATALGQADHLLRAALAVVHEHGFVVRCAWCGRFEVGDLLVEAEAMPAAAQLAGLVEARRVSHGVCRPCFDGLDASFSAGL
jgi:hypothetical protein